jgi:hypothetical protein
MKQMSEGCRGRSFPHRTGQDEEGVEQAGGSLVSLNSRPTGCDCYTLKCDARRTKGSLGLFHGLREYYAPVGLVVLLVRTSGADADLHELGRENGMTMAR